MRARGAPGALTALALALCGCLHLVFGGAASAGDAAPGLVPASDLLARAFFNLYADDYIQTLELETRSGRGRAMSRKLQITRKQSDPPGRALLRFLEPYDIRKTSILILENDGASDDLYVYLPATRTTRHLSANQRGDSFFGTDLSYEDIEPKYVEDYEPRRIGTGAGQGTPCSLIEMRARPHFESTYERMVSCIEDERGIILWTDFYRRGAVVKRLEIELDSVRQIGERFIPFTMTMSSLRRRSSTVVRTERYEIRPAIPDELFSTWNLEVGDANRDRTRSDGGD